MIPRIEVRQDAAPDPTTVPANVTVTGDSTDPNQVMTATISGDGKTADRPAWLPEKFKTAEDMAKAYASLESKLGAPKADAPAPTIAQPAQPVDAVAAVAKAGLDMAALNKEYADNAGKLTDSTLAKFEAAGIPKATVEQYVKGQEAIAAKVTADAVALAGDETTLKAALSWGQANLSASDAAAYNKALESGDPSMAKLALQGLLSSYRNAVGTDPKLVRPNANPAARGVEPFASNAQLVAAMADKRYNTDPAYRKGIADRLAISNLW